MSIEALSVLPGSSAFVQPQPLHDILITASPVEDMYVVAPYHAAAAAWLNEWIRPWTGEFVEVGEGLCLDSRDIRALIADAITARWRLRLSSTVDSITLTV